MKKIIALGLMLAAGPVGASPHWDANTNHCFGDDGLLVDNSACHVYGTISSSGTLPSGIGTTLTVTSPLCDAGWVMVTVATTSGYGRYVNKCAAVGDLKDPR